jgi:hypothetical protein
MLTWNNPSSRRKSQKRCLTQHRGPQQALNCLFACDRYACSREFLPSGVYLFCCQFQPRVYIFCARPLLFSDEKHPRQITQHTLLTMPWGGKIDSVCFLRPPLCYYKTHGDPLERLHFCSTMWRRRPRVAAFVTRRYRESPNNMCARPLNRSPPRSRVISLFFCTLTRAPEIGGEGVRRTFFRTTMRRRNNLKVTRVSVNDGEAAALGPVLQLTLRSPKI